MIDRSNIRGSKFYIAGPFFNENQLKTVVDIENLFNEFSIRFFSPRLSGVIINEKFSSDEQKEERLKEIYLENIRMLYHCNHMISIIDDRDTGTMFEFGYFTAISNLDERFSRKIITFTNNNYGVNVMLRNSCHAHCHGIDSLKKLLDNIKNNDMYFDERSSSEHQNFSPNVT